MPVFHYLSSYNLWSKKAFTPIRDFASMNMNTQVI